jgi:uncharacterized protein (TIGR03084 family)
MGRELVETMPGRATTVSEVRQDLIDEQRALDAIVAPLSADSWATGTASARWTVADQIGHLTYFDEAAALAIDDPAAFASQRDELVGSFDDEVTADDMTLSRFRSMAPSELLDAWRRARRSLADASVALTDGVRVDWYGPSMGAKSFLTARLMEVWAHGQDVVDAVGALRPATDRLRHVAQLGVITRGWSYAVRGLTPPDTDVRVELAAPSGARWAWGRDDAADRIAGPAEDFCLVVTQRRHVDDTGLVLAGDSARDWMLRAQAFAGAPTTGPTARTGS